MGTGKGSRGKGAHASMNFFVDSAVKFIGDTHRPIALLMVAIAFFWAVVNKSDATTLGAIGLILGGLYWGKTAENITDSKQNPPTKISTQ